MNDWIRVKRSDTAGFTLVEVVIAIGIVTAIMIPLVILLGYGLDNAGDITARDRALRLVPAIEQRLNSADFSEVRNWGTSGGRLYAYVYRAAPATGKATGGPGSATTGNDAFIAVARSAAKAGDIAIEIASIEGQLFRVDLKPVIPLARAADGSEVPVSRQNAAAVELEAEISRVLNPQIWQTSKVEHRITLNFVINR